MHTQGGHVGHMTLQRQAASPLRLLLSASPHPLTPSSSPCAPAVMACQSIANVVKSSLGPVGLDKMLVDAIGDTTVTNDGATILNLLEVDHPAGKVLVELAQLQVNN